MNLVAVKSEARKWYETNDIGAKAYALKHLIKTGCAPHHGELAATLGLQPEEAGQVQHKAAEFDKARRFVKDIHHWSDI
jgi:hypothetical protein